MDEELEELMGLCRNKSKSTAAEAASASALTTPSRPAHAAAAAAPRAAVAKIEGIEQYSELNVKLPRKLSREDVQLRMRGRHYYGIGKLPQIPQQALDSPDPENAWATVGVLVSKSQQRAASKGGNYSVWRFSCLAAADDMTVLVSSQALTEHTAMAEGTLMVVSQPRLLPCKDGSKKLTFAVSESWQMNQIGTALDFAFCSSIKADGTRCSMAINKSQSPYCKYHVKAEFAKQQRKRPLDGSSSNDSSMPAAKAATTVNHALRQQDRLPFGKQQSTNSHNALLQSRQSTASSSNSSSSSSLQQRSSYTTATSMNVPRLQSKAANVAVATRFGSSMLAVSSNAGSSSSSCKGLTLRTVNPYTKLNTSTANTVSNTPSAVSGKATAAASSANSKSAVTAAASTDILGDLLDGVITNNGTRISSSNNINKSNQQQQLMHGSSSNSITRTEAATLNNRRDGSVVIPNESYIFKTPKVNISMINGRYAYNSSGIHMQSAQLTAQVCLNSYYSITVE
jgi:Primase zinc finger